ncbi:MAG TPA: hypothetical protein VHM28_09955 [Anaerolineales bacterium]|jgi:hypothetical protein|nr:hypothetical protein [Anaerolineales bacterium]
MDTVIYSASPFQAFLPTFGTIAFMLLIAVVGLASAFLNRNQGRGARIGLGIAGGFLLIAGCVFAAITLIAITNGQKTVSAMLNDKIVAHDNCGDNGSTCTRYVLETTTGSNAYDFNVPQSAYDKAQTGTCYKFTYFPKKGLFSEPSTGSGSYQQVDQVTRIEIADAESCQ